MASATSIACSSSFLSKMSPLFDNRKRSPVVRFACKAKNGDKNSEISSPGRFDRRNVLIGLGGLYGKTSFGTNPLAFAAPPEPNYKDCVDATEPNNTPINCCPSPASQITDYVPSLIRVPRIRISAQSVTYDSDYYKKYTKAVEKMNLPSDDPLNFMQQANVHCATAMVLTISRAIQSYYMKSMDPGCFSLEQIYLHNPHKSPLYDSLRNPQHLPPSVIDLDWPYNDESSKPEDQVKYNLVLMYLITQSKRPCDFFGKAYRKGYDITKMNTAGAIEQTPHNCVHSWTGTITDLSNPGDMGA